MKVIFKHGVKIIAPYFQRQLGYYGHRATSPKAMAAALGVAAGDRTEKHLQNADTSTSVTLRCDLDLLSKSRKLMSLARCCLLELYLGARYDVYGFNVLRDIIICLFYVTFDLQLLSRSLALFILLNVYIKNVVCRFSRI